MTASDLTGRETALLEACKAALRAFRGMYDLIEDEMTLLDEEGLLPAIFEHEPYWPLTQLREAIQAAGHGTDDESVGTVPRPELDDDLEDDEEDGE